MPTRLTPALPKGTTDVDIQIDLTRCQGHARCLENAPEVFGYDDRSAQTYLLVDPNDADLEAVKRAVDGCPEGALVLRRD